MRSPVLTDLASRLLFGRHIANEDLAGLLGKDCAVASFHGQENTPFLGVVAGNVVCEIHPGPVAVFPKGMGDFSGIARQIGQALKLGIKSVVSPATGDFKDHPDNQQYYWLALAGFDAPLPGAMEQGCRFISELLLQPGGPKLWRRQGGAFVGKLDLTRGSRVRALWDELLEGKFCTRDLANAWGSNQVVFGEHPPGGIGIILKVNGKNTLLPPGNLGIVRTDMPQIDAEDLPELLQFLAARQIPWKETSLAANSLRASQKDIDPARAMKMAKEMTSEDLEKPVLVSQDHYLADGHHRWLGQYFQDSLAKVVVLEIALPIKELLKELHLFCEKMAGPEFTVDLVVLEDCLTSQVAGWDQDVRAGRLTSCSRAALVGASLGVGTFSADRVFLDHDRGTFQHHSDDRPNLWPHPAGRIRRSHAEFPGGSDQSNKLLHFLRHRLRHRFSEDVLHQATHLVRHLESDQEARHVYRSLVHGGHEPRDREEAAQMLHRCLIKLPRYDGPRMHKLHIGLLLDADAVGQDQIKALLSFYDAGLVRDYIKSFQDAGKLAQHFSTVPQEVHNLFQGASQEQKLIEWRQVMTNARLLRMKLDTSIAEARQHLARMLACQSPNTALRLNSIQANNVSGLARDAWGKAVMFVQSITSLRPDERGKPLVRVLAQDRKYPRSEFLVRNSSSLEDTDADNTPGVRVFLGDYDGVLACVHVLGHVLENFLPGARRAALEFLFYRTGKRFAGRTSFDLMVGGEALEGEEGREGGFHLGGTDALYVGKVMSIGLGTEVLAMGLQELWADPAGFARGDQEFCRFILGILRGDFRRG